jgi:RNA polymerase sigma-70 factor (ECF subfamily)
MLSEFLAPTGSLALEDVTNPRADTNLRLARPRLVGASCAQPPDTQGLVDSKFGRRASTTRLCDQVFNEYDSWTQAGSSAEEVPELALEVDADCAELKELLAFRPSNAKRSSMDSIPAEASAADQIRSDVRSFPMDELAHPHERELRGLMVASLDGDGVAYDTLLRRLTGHLRAYYRYRFARIGHGPTEAEDLLQEVLIAVHTHRHTYDREQPFTPWIHAIARYKFLDYLRRTKSTFKDMPLSSAEELTARSDVAAVESGLDLQQLMSKISSKAREVLQYVKLEGLSVREAAVRSGMSESAVKVAVHRALKALALQIRKEGETS